MGFVYATSLEFNIYCIIKLLGFGMHYFQDSKNCFSLFILICIDLGIILEQANVTPILFSIGVALGIIKNYTWLYHITSPKIKVIIDVFLPIKKQTSYKTLEEGIYSSKCPKLADICSKHATFG